MNNQYMRGRLDGSQKKNCLTLIAEYNYYNNDSFPVTKRDKLYQTERKETERKKT
jgi:hypothetical protein